MDYSDRPLVAVVLVNYNGLDDTRECLLSLREVDYRNMAVILVDNASADNSYAVIKDEFPEVHCIRSEKNLGFTGGNNLGMKKAYELRPDYLLLLNNDTTVSPNILRELTGFMAEHPEVGLAGPIALFYDAPDVVAFAGGHLDRNSGIVSFYNKRKRAAELADAVIYCNFIEGAALFVRTSVIQAVGGFNDLYFLTSEESELCIRISDLGYKIAVITSCSIRHKVSRTMGAESELSNYFIFRNKLWFIRRNASDHSISGFLPIIRYIVICLLSFIVKKRNFAAAKGIISGIFDYLRGVDGPGRFKERLDA
jgi:GT2 family glycosyltransferase